MKKPFVLGKRGEDVLKAVNFYRYMTAQDIAYLLFSPSAIVRVRQLLASLCGGVDFGRNQYLYRFRMPDVSAGNPQRVYVLGARGREFLSRELGLSIDKGFRPDEGKQLSFTQVRHNLAVVDRGTMYRQRFKRHISSRIEFVRSGEYEKVFGIKSVMIAYVATGGTGEHEEGRRKALCGWTMELLKEQRRESWARTFRFCRAGLEEIYERPLFDGKIWYRPDEESPVGLFGE